MYLCMCVSVGALEWKCPSNPEGSIRSLKSMVNGCCQYLDGAEKQSEVLCNSRKCSEPQRHLSSSLIHL